MTQSWQLWALLSAVFAGATAVLAKVGVQGVDSNLATALRTLVILIFAWGIVGATGGWREIPHLGTRTLVFLVLSGLATGASWLCYFRALQFGPASHVAPIDKLSVIFVVLFAAVFLHEPLTWRTLGGIICICGGVLLLL